MRCHPWFHDRGPPHVPHDVHLPQRRVGRCHDPRRRHPADRPGGRRGGGHLQQCERDPRLLSEGAGRSGPCRNDPAGLGERCRAHQGGGGRFRRRHHRPGAERHGGEQHPVQGRHARLRRRQSHGRGERRGEKPLRRHRRRDDRDRRPLRRPQGPIRPGLPHGAQRQGPGRGRPQWHGRRVDQLPGPGELLGRRRGPAGRQRRDDELDVRGRRQLPRQQLLAETPHRQRPRRRSAREPALSGLRTLRRPRPWRQRQAAAGNPHALARHLLRRARHLGGQQRSGSSRASTSSRTAS